MWRQQLLQQQHLARYMSDTVSCACIFPRREQPSRSFCDRPLRPTLSYRKVVQTKPKVQTATPSSAVCKAQVWQVIKSSLGNITIIAVEWHDGPRKRECLIANGPEAISSSKTMAAAPGHVIREQCDCRRLVNSAPSFTKQCPSNRIPST